MSTYKHNCHMCTNKAINVKGEKWCRPMIEGRKACYIESGETGKDFVFNCDEYTLDHDMTILKLTGGMK